MLEALIAEFGSIEDPRCEWKVEHRLLDILVIAVCAVIGEAESFEDIALYGRCKRDWLKRFLELPNGIPSHDTFRRVFTLIDPEAFERCFLGWVRAVFRPDQGALRQVAVDGKAVRRSFDRRNGRSPLHLVSAYATEHGLVLAQRATEATGGELAVIPDLLDGLDLSGCLVSLDALACRSEIAEPIVGRGGDYLITLKGNRKKVHAEVKGWFAANAFALGAPLRPFFDAFDGSHGRLVRRRAFACLDVGAFATLADWPGLREVRWRSRPSAGSPAPARSRPRSGTTSPAPSSRRRSWRPPSGTTGGSRTGCTGSSTSASARTRAGYGSGTPPGTWPCCAGSRLTSPGPMVR
jgi:hypothetical protein